MNKVNTARVKDRSQINPASVSDKKEFLVHAVNRRCRTSRLHYLIVTKYYKTLMLLLTLVTTMLMLAGLLIVKSRNVTVTGLQEFSMSSE